MGEDLGPLESAIEAVATEAVVTEGCGARSFLLDFPLSPTTSTTAITTKIPLMIGQETPRDERLATTGRVLCTRAVGGVLCVWERVVLSVVGRCIAPVPGRTLGVTARMLEVTG